MDGGRDLASSIELQDDFTAADLHQVQSATASQEFWSVFDPQVLAVKNGLIGSTTGTGISKSSSSSSLGRLLQSKIADGRASACSIVLHEDLTAADLHHEQEAALH